MTRLVQDQDAGREKRVVPCEVERGGESGGSRADDENVVILHGRNLTTEHGRRTVHFWLYNFYTALGHKLRFFRRRNAQFVTVGIIQIPEQDG
jgi:hypothetical protein